LLSGDSRLCSPRVRAPPRSPLFPYTTLFRSHPQRHRADRDRATLGRRCPAQGGVAGVSGIAGSVDHSRTSGGEGGRIVAAVIPRSEEHTSELQSRFELVCRLLLEKKKSLQNPPACHTPEIFLVARTISSIYSRKWAEAWRSLTTTMTAGSISSSSTGPAWIPQLEI